MPYTTYTD